jgi:hypothetical protein
MNRDARVQAGQPATGGGQPLWSEVSPELTRSEFRHPDLMDAEFLRRLGRARRRAGVPFRIASSHRTAAENALAGGAAGSAHLEVPCRAADLAVRSNEEQLRIVAALLAEGFARIGVYPAREAGSGSMPVDAARGRPEPRLWTRYRLRGGGPCIAHVRP